MQCDALLKKIDELNESYISVWEDVCNIESPTAYKEGVDAVCNYFVAMAKERGWDVEVLELENAGNAACITINPDAPAAPVCFSGHIDTVHPVGLFGSPAVRKDDTYIYGPGVTDCKGGVVASFLAMDALAQCGFKSRPVKLIIQTDEETGSKNSGKKTIEFMCEKAKNSIAFLNTECFGDNSAVVARKGILRADFTIYGKAAHSALCHKGANAVAEAAHKILKLEEMKDPDGITCNCSVIQGGTVSNTVAAECHFTADIRFANQQQYESAVQALEEQAAHSYIEGCTCELKHGHRPAMSLEDRNLSLLNTINDIYETNNMPRLKSRSAPGGSDAAYTTLAGIPTLDNLGVEGGYIHSAKEWAFLASLAHSAKLQAAVAYCI